MKYQESSSPNRSTPDPIMCLFINIILRDKKNKQKTKKPTITGTWTLGKT